MTRRKTKLVCRGWGIDRPLDGCLWTNRRGYRSWNTRPEAIESYDNSYGKGAYRQSRRRGRAIAKKLWVEVNDE